jgi:hypothetical protein
VYRPEKGRIRRALFFAIQRPGLDPEESSINTYSEKKQNG